MHTTPAKLIVYGSICIDRIMNFGGKYKDLIQADKLHVLSLSIFVDELTHTRGGTAANVSYSLALLGEHPILLGAVGQDAQQYVSALSNLGVNTKQVHTSHLPTPTFTVLTDSDNNQVGGFYPGAMSDISTLSLKPWFKKRILPVICAGDPKGMDQLVTECLIHNMPYVYDVGQQVTNLTVDQLKHGVSGAHILFANDYELGVIVSRTGYSEAELRERIPIIVTTLGERGTHITGKTVKKPLLVPAVSDITVVDPTGAGDSYRAGFLYSYIRDWDLVTCARLGSVVASYAIAIRGTQEHHYALADIKQKYYTAYGDQVPS